MESMVDYSLQGRVAELESRIANLRSLKISKQQQQQHVGEKQGGHDMHLNEDGRSQSRCLPYSDCTASHVLSSVPKVQTQISLPHTSALRNYGKGNFVAVSSSKKTAGGVPVQVSSHMALAALAAELEKSKRRNLNLEEKVKKVEHDLLLERSTKTNMLEALNVSRRDASVLQLELKEAEKAVHFVRAENTELLDMVEEQHAMLSRHQARANSAEREVNRLQDETQIMREALEAADEYAEALLERAEAAEKELEALAMQQHRLSMDGYMGDDMFSERKQAEFAKNISKVSDSKLEEMSDIISTLRLSTIKSNEESKDCSEDRDLVAQQSKLLKQQQQLLNVLVKRHNRSKDDFWRKSSVFLTSISISALAASGFAVFLYARKVQHSSS